MSPRKGVPRVHKWVPSQLLDVPDTTWAYLAGLFDGEGSLSFQRGAYRVSIAQLASTGLCQWIADTLGCGVVTEHRQLRPNLVHNWRLSKQYEVQAFLRGVEPYLRVKREVAVVALAHYDNVIATAMRWVDVS